MGAGQERRPCVSCPDLYHKQFRITLGGGPSNCRLKRQPARAYHWPMRTINRRDVLSLIASSSGVLAFAQAADPALDQSQVFSLKKLKVVSQQDGWETRPTVHGKLPDGEALDIHHSVLPAGHMPHAPHQHKHAELMILLDGEIDFYDKGVTKHMESGDMAFAAPGQLHGWKNVGKTPARYYVIAIGSDT